MVAASFSVRKRTISSIRNSAKPSRTPRSVPPQWWSQLPQSRLKKLSCAKIIWLPISEERKRSIYRGSTTIPTCHSVRQSGIAFMRLALMLCQDKPREQRHFFIKNKKKNWRTTLHSLLGDTGFTDVPRLAFKAFNSLWKYCSKH